MSVNPKTRTGALYIRVSTNMQTDLSPDAQRRLLLEYAAKNNILISNQYIYEEDGVSGRKASKRPKFQQMIATAKSKEHPIDVILVWKFSRFARNQEESIVYKSMLKRDKVDVISISEPLAEGPFGSLIERIIEWMDEYYSIRLSGEVHRGMSENAMRGNYQARPPLGYKIEHYKEAPVIVPEESKIIQLIFNLYTEDGYGIFEITKKLNEMGYQTARKKAFQRRSVMYILKNPTYIGKTIWNQRDSNQEARDPSEWIIADGSHEPIISEEQFQKAQDRISSEYHPAYRKPSGICKHWLSGLLKCSACGRTLTTSCHKKDGRTYINFQCYGYQKGLCTTSHQISEKKIVPLILAAMKSVLDSGELSFTVIDSTAHADGSERSVLLARLEEIDKKENRIKQAYRDGIDTLEEYKENKSILLAERTDLQSRIDKLNIPRDNIENSNKKIMLNKINSVYEMVQNPDVEMSIRNESMKSIVEKIVFSRPDETIDIFFYLSNPYK